ncbi:MAG: hypothetical protein WB713_00195, partial [Methyloceanibacter sp.]
GEAARHNLAPMLQTPKSGQTQEVRIEAVLTSVSFPASNPPIRIFREDDFLAARAPASAGVLS